MRTRRPGVRSCWALTALVAAAVLSACGPGTPATPISLPVPTTGEVTFYLALPGSTSQLVQAATAVATPGSSQHRHFSSPATIAQQFGATDAQINTVAASIKTLGLQFAADPSRLFARVIGTPAQWQAALGSPLQVQPATASNPFTTYGLPGQLPAALQPSGTSVILPAAQVYAPGSEGRGPSRISSANRTMGEQGAAASGSSSATPAWPLNTGTSLSAGCSAAVLQNKQVYTEQQVQNAYGVTALRPTAPGTPVVAVIDLGGGWLASDLQMAGRCFGYTPPSIGQVQGDGVPTVISNADPETSLDLQTAMSVAPGAQVRLVQTTPSNMLDAFSRAPGNSRGVPDVISLSYGGCALSEDRTAPGYVAIVDAILAAGALAGTSVFVAAGDSGSTACGAEREPGPRSASMWSPATPHRPRRPGRERGSARCLLTPALAASLRTCLPSGRSSRTIPVTLASCFSVAPCRAAARTLNTPVPGT